MRPNRAHDPHRELGHRPLVGGAGITGIAGIAAPSRRVAGRMSRNMCRCRQASHGSGCASGSMRVRRTASAHGNVPHALFQALLAAHPYGAWFDAQRVLAPAGAGVGWAGASGAGSSFFAVFVGQSSTGCATRGPCVLAVRRAQHKYWQRLVRRPVCRRAFRRIELRDWLPHGSLESLAREPAPPRHTPDERPSFGQLGGGAQISAGCRGQVVLAVGVMAGR